MTALPPSRVRGTLAILLAIVFFLTAAETASAQWTFWSAGTPCVDGSVIRLDGVGTMSSGSLNTLVATDGPPLGACFMIVGFTSLRVPFGGGTLGPNPDIIFPVTFDAAGGWSLPFTWPALPPDVMLCYQIWCPTPALSPPWCSSNTLKSTSS